MFTQLRNTANPEPEILLSFLQVFYKPPGQRRWDLFYMSAHSSLHFVLCVVLYELVPLVLIIYVVLTVFSA